MSYRVTVPCSRAQGEAIAHTEDLFPGTDDPPVVVADEPDDTRPDEWQIHAYFEAYPSSGDIALLTGLGDGPPQIEKLAEQDWVTMSQAGLQPIRAGRFHVHTPTHPPDSQRINFEIDAGLAFGTGQHATTSGCLEALDRLEREGSQFGNIADIGTGTGILAFAALALWPEARCIGTDVDATAIGVARDNAAINGIRSGMQSGQLLLATIDGMDSPLLAARAPFDLIIANILAGPLIELAPDFAKVISPGGTVMLAGLLETQADAVIGTYERLGFSLRDHGSGEWPVLLMSAG